MRKKTLKCKARVYVCHTFYHVYVAYLKECERRRIDGTGYRKADVMLSTLSTDFGSLQERLEATGFWNKVYRFEEKRFLEFPQLEPLKRDRGNIVINMFYRIRFCKAYGRLEAPYIPVDLREYEDIYVFCDSDPIGYYLSYEKIHYHALEDGLNCIANYDTARYDNRGAFPVKAWLSRHNLIFIQNGYGKYCIDMEVNDISILKYGCSKYIEKPRQAMVDALTEDDKNVILQSFIPDIEEIRTIIMERIRQEGREAVLILSEALCSLTVRKQIFRDIIDEYCENCIVFIKPHPRDELDYAAEFPQEIVLDGKFPMEMLNFIEGLHFSKVYSVLTEVKEIAFADECIRLGHDFLDRYEDPESHRFNEKI